MLTHRKYRPRQMAGPLAVLTVVGLLAGCAADSYKATVGEFADAVSKADTALQTLHTEMNRNTTELRFRQAAAGKVKISPPDDSCARTAEDCRLMVDQNGKLTTLPSATDEFKAGELMHGLARYANNLKAIVESDSGAKATEHLNAAAGSLQSLGKAAGKDTTGLGQFAVPVGNLLAWAVGEYVNLLQVQYLRDATSKGSGYVTGASSAARAVASNEQKTIRSATYKGFTDANEEYISAVKNHAAFDKLVASAAAYDAVLKTHADAVFTALDDAHDKLAKRLAGKDVTPAELAAAVQGFSAKVDAFWKLIQAVEAAAKPSDKPKQ